MPKYVVTPEDNEDEYVAEEPSDDYPPEMQEAQIAYYESQGCICIYEDRSHEDCPYHDILLGVMNGKEK